ncbi:MAG: DNA-deoxyinosine glycosylase [Eubacteriales bacterium]|nr:DNA-deoxyinosine glycosylase [Eubacteriales bacterium]
MRKTMIKHPIEPLYDKDSEILILGSFPSVKSREQGFFYGHPQNRFWRVIAAVCDSDVPNTIDEKRKFLLNNRIALWDVIGECDISGSADTSIKNVIANDLRPILETSRVKRIFVNGKTAEKYYIRHIQEQIGYKAVCLPSTSPANAAWSQERLIEEWKKIISDNS